MKLLSWLMAISFLVILMAEAVAFHRATVCRQIAWLKSSELLTRSVLSTPREYEHEEHLSCQLFVERKNGAITWRRLPNATKHNFDLKLEGKL